MLSWSSDRCSRKAAALAYYTVFSLAPLVVVVVAVASWFVSDELLVNGLTEQAKTLLGDRGASLITQLLANAKHEHDPGLAALLGIAVLIVGATSAFAELKSSLDDIWGVGEHPHGGLWGLLRARLVSFGIVLTLSFLLIVSMILNAAVGMFSAYFGAWLGIGGTLALEAGSFAASFVVITLLFAAIYKLLPEVRLSWRDVGLSAVLTASLFMAGRVVIGNYIGNAAAVTVYGTASSLVVVLLWIYYSTMIFFLGAEIIKVWREPGVVRRRARDEPRVEPAASPSRYPPGIGAHAG